MKKIHKILCRMKSIITSILAAITLAFNPVVSLTTAYAATAVGYAPITGGNVGGFLEHMGYLDKVDGGWKWVKGSRILNDYYTQDIFGNWVPKVKTDEVLTDDDLSPLLGTVIPENTYTTDGTNYYVGNKKVTTADMFVTAKSLVGINYSMPTNIAGSQYTVGVAKRDGYYMGASFSSKNDIDKDVYYIPFVTTPSNSAYIFSNSFSPVSDGIIRYNLIKKDSSKYTSGSNGDFVHKYYFYPICNPFSGSGFGTSDNLDNTYPNFSFSSPSSFITVTGSGELTYSSDNQFTLLFTRGVPVNTVEADKEKLNNALVQVKPASDDDDDNNPMTPPTPEPPDFWQIWQTVEELIEEIDSGKDTNGNTKLGEYVTNNYIYNKVDVDINVPDKIDNNVNLSGGLDVNASGDVDITIHEDVSLPTGGDGSGFYNPDAVDAISALTTNNPAVNVIKGLFEAIDPALVGIFSVGVSLLVVLGLWKLIRG